MAVKMKSALLVAFFCFSIILINGCETTVGAAKGVACGVGSTAEGVGKDTCNLFKFIQTVDNWMRKNLW